MSGSCYYQHQCCIKINNNYIKSDRTIRSLRFISIAKSYYHSQYYIYKFCACSFHLNHLFLITKLRVPNQRSWCLPWSACQCDKYKLYYKLEVYVSLEIYESDLDSGPIDRMNVPHYECLEAVCESNSNNFI